MSSDQQDTVVPVNIFIANVYLFVCLFVDLSGVLKQPLLAHVNASVFVCSVYITLFGFVAFHFH